MKLLPTLLIALSTLLPVTLSTTSPDRLNEALKSAAKAANASPRPASSREPGVPNLSGLGIVGGMGKSTNYAEECRAKNAKMAKVIEMFCGLQRIEVPSEFTSKGWCGYGGRDTTTAQVDSSFGGEKVWCVKVGSKKGKCKVNGALFSRLDCFSLGRGVADVEFAADDAGEEEVCGKIDGGLCEGREEGRWEGEGWGVFVYQTGFYDGLAAEAEISPFRGATKPADY